MKPKALVLQSRGANRDLDVIEALTLAGADSVGVPLNDLRSRKTNWNDFQMLVVPGGFSYADALSAGKLLALDLNSYFGDEIAAFVEFGKPVIGICNGFQALVKSGILPGNAILGEAKKSSQVTLTFNEGGRFECRWVHLAPISQKCIWTKGLADNITCPVAHGEGKFQISEHSLLDKISSMDQIALTYILPDGSPAKGEYPVNPNGSALDIAGICNPGGNVLGLMPHPENHIYHWQHPLHTRGVSGQSGLSLFENGVRFASNI